MFLGKKSTDELLRWCGCNISPENEKSSVLGHMMYWLWWVGKLNYMGDEGPWVLFLRDPSTSADPSLSCLSSFPLSRISLNALTSQETMTPTVDATAKFIEEMRLPEGSGSPRSSDKRSF